MFYNKSSEEDNKAIKATRTAGNSVLDGQANRSSTFVPDVDEDDGGESEVILENIDRQGSKITQKR